MISLQGLCPDDGFKLLDMDSEYVCERCGMVQPKEDLPGLIETTQGQLDPGYVSAPDRALVYTQFWLGTDHHGKEGEALSLYRCACLIERICDKQKLPGIAKGESVRIARALMDRTTDITIPCIAAYSVIDACKVMGITKVAQKQVMRTLTDLGYRLKPRDMMDLQEISGSRTWIAEDHVSGVVARIASVATRPVQERPLRTQSYLVLSGVPIIDRGSHNPRGIAATAVYAGEVMLSKEYQRPKAFSQKEIASVADVEEYTVREAYGQFFKNLTVGHIDTFCLVDTTA